MKIWDVFFPPRCPLCGKLLAAGEGPVHGKCYEKLVPVKEPRCQRCGKPLASREVSYCLDCARKMKRGCESFDRGRAVWLYEGKIKDSLMDYKYRGMRSYTDFYGDEAVKYAGGWIRKMRPECLIPVPIHPRKKRIRGYNQAELIAGAIGDRMHVPVAEEALVRKRWTDPQKAVSGQERRHNLARSIEIGRLPAGVRRVMLIDDIYTTGSTMDVCGALLKGAGVERVYFLTLCIGSGMQ